MSGLAERATRALQAAGFLPKSARQLSLTVPSGNLLPQLVDAWVSSNTASSAKRSRIAWLAASSKLGSRLTVGIAGGSRFTTWIGDRFIWWPRAVPRGRLVGLVSSRLPRRLDTQTDWIAALRAACVELNPASDVLLCAPSTTTGRFIKRFAVHSRLQLLVLHEPRTTSIDGWLARIERAELPHKSGGSVSAFLSPLLSGGTPPPRSVRETPLRDRSIAALSDLLIALHLRRDSQTDRLVRARLRDLRYAGDEVRVALGRQLVPLDLAQDLAALGATIWSPLDQAVQDERVTSRSLCNSRLARTKVRYRCSTLRGEKSTTRRAVQPIIEPESCIITPQRKWNGGRVSIVAPPGSDGWDYLTHCTRRLHGPWPDQSEEDFVDELILNPSKADRSPVAALRRIMAQQRIIATYATIRGPGSAVCFTAVPLLDLPQLRTFRPHRGRWDFEPYGICIRRSWLAQRGSQPVRYGEQPLWDALPDEERPFFQRAASHSKRTNRTMNWQVEQEWRHLGDVDLRELPASEGLVFVGTEREAREIVAISRWPVTVLGRIIR